MNIDRFIATISTLLALAAIVVAIYPSELNKILGETYSIAGYTIVLSIAVFIVVQLIVLAIFVIISRRNARESHTLALKANTLEKELKRYRGESLLDVVTGIPNQSKLRDDIVGIAETINEKDKYQVIMLDLDGFGKINDQYGYRKGDFVIKAIAQNIYYSMRRDEEAYKRPFTDNTTPDDLWRRIYRKYSGGDEFIFLIRGTEDEALGFLLRLQRRFDGEFGKEVGTILGVPWKLSFHAGVCPLDPGDTFESMLDRVEDCLRLARQKGSVSRVYWYSSGKPSVKFPEGSFAARTYDDARKQFAL